jgi:hypothetical protein
MPRQQDLAKAADMKQSRISMMETPGAANMTLDTLSSVAAALRVGLIVKFVPFSEMLEWENGFSQDQFNVTKIDEDSQFLNPHHLTLTSTKISVSSIRVHNGVSGNVITLNEALSNSTPTVLFYRDVIVDDAANTAHSVEGRIAGNSKQTHMCVDFLPQPMFTPVKELIGADA